LTEPGADGLVLKFNKNPTTDDALLPAPIELLIFSLQVQQVMARSTISALEFEVLSFKLLIEKS
jgi:hypothetical protein